MKQMVQPRFRRKSLWRRVVTPRRIAVLGILSITGLGLFTYFYFKYSRLIEDKLRGEVTIRQSGIYAQPRLIKTGQSVSLTELRGYLDTIGYVAASQRGDERRGRYTVNGQTLTIEPGKDAVLDNAAAFPSIQTTFSKSGESIVRITETATNRALQSAELEPELLATLSNSEHERRKIVKFEDLPKHLVDAIVAIEDRRFLEHGGVDYRGLTRAVWINVTNREVQQGGSTVTQQLVKNLILTPEKTYRRKLQEAFIAIVLETRLSKPEIFQLYCNEVFLGQQGTYSINGVGEAANAYFGKDVVNLTLAESAFLAGIIRGPSLYSPYSNPDRARERRDQVLDAMVETGAISAEQAETTKQLQLDVRSRRAVANANAPYFVNYLQEELGRAFSTTDLTRGSLRVYSTIDMDLQRAAEQSVRATLANLDKVFASRKRDPIPPGTLQASLVALDANTGEILAMVGGRDYDQSQFNRAIEANRQPGSVFKPVVYAAALATAYSNTSQKPITAATPFLDAPEKFIYGAGQVYEPGNYGDKYSMNEVPLREGLVHSLNVVTVRVFERVGPYALQQVAAHLGLPKPPPYPATALGTTEATPLQVAQAYTAFANLGARATPTGVRRVTNASGATIGTLKTTHFPALQPQVAYIITDFLKDVINRGTAAGARERGFRAMAAGKTGTSRDGWFAGYTPNLVCVVWVGFDDNSQLGIEGSKSALPIWTDFMKAALRLRPALGGDEFPKPNEKLVEVDIDPASGGLALTECPSRRKELFIEGTQPSEPCPLHDAGTAPQPHEDGDDYSEPPYRLQPPSPPADTETESPPTAPPADRPRRVVPPREGALKSDVPPQGPT
jgi:penicillin-binding protein 1B